MLIRGRKREAKGERGRMGGCWASWIRRKARIWKERRKPVIFE